MEPEPEPERKPPSAMWLAAGAKVRQLNKKEAEADSLAATVSSSDMLARQISGVVSGRRSMSMVVRLSEALRSGEAPTAESVGSVVSKLNPMWANDRERCEILSCLCELLRRGHAELLLECGAANAAVDLLETSCGESRQRGAVLAGEFPGVLLYFLQLWMRTEPGHWPEILTKKHVQLLCAVATWRPLLPDNFPKMLANDIHAGLALHCLRFISVDVKVLKGGSDADAKETCLRTLEPKSKDGKLGDKPVADLLSTDVIRNAEQLLDYNAAVAQSRHEPPDRALLSKELWIANAPDLRVLAQPAEGEEVELDTQDRSCFQTSERACDHMMKFPGFCCLGLPASICSRLVFCGDREARMQWTKRACVPRLAKPLSSLLKKFDKYKYWAPNLGWGANLAHCGLTAFHWWLIVSALHDPQFVLGLDEGWDLHATGLSAVFILFIMSRIFWAMLLSIRTRTVSPFSVDWSC